MDIAVGGYSRNPVVEVKNPLSTKRPETESAPDIIIRLSRQKIQRPTFPKPPVLTVPVSIPAEPHPLLQRQQSGRQKPALSQLQSPVANIVLQTEQTTQKFRQAIDQVSVHLASTIRAIGYELLFDGQNTDKLRQARQQTQQLMATTQQHIALGESYQMVYKLSPDLLGLTAHHGMIQVVQQLNDRLEDSLQQCLNESKCR